MATRKEQLQSQAIDLEIDITDLTVAQLEDAIAAAEGDSPPADDAPADDPPPPKTKAKAKDDDDVVWVENTTKTLLIICDDKRTRLGPGPHPIKRSLWEQAVLRATKGEGGKPPNKGMALMLDMGQLNKLDEPAEQFATTLSQAEIALLKGEKEADSLSELSVERALLAVKSSETPAKLQAWAKSDDRVQVKRAIAKRLGDLKKLTVAAKKK